MPTMPRSADPGELAAEVAHDLGHAARGAAQGMADAAQGVAEAAHDMAEAAQNAAHNAAAAFAQSSRNAVVGPWLLRRVLAVFVRGSVSVILPSGQRIEHRCPQPGPHGVMQVHSLRVFRRVLTHGDVGFAEGYIAGEWDSPDLPRLIAFAAANVAELDATFEGFWPVRMLRKLGHGRNRNTRRAAKRNIAFHYDLGNDFYRQWLDTSMTYSAACELAPGQTLEAAQAAKRARIAALLDLSGGAEVLEIGCGWGALAIDIAEAGAGSVTGLTLSREQLAFAQDAVTARGLAGKVDLRLQDYREEAGRYDRIVSIEMLEAVGEAYWPDYFGKLASCLAPGGRAVLQAITIDESRYQSYKRSPDFIQRFIFPGGMLPTPAIMHAQARAAGLRVSHVETFAAGYADTLAEWRRRFLGAWPAIRGLGFDEAFRRTWDYYLCYCEAGFRTGTIDVGLWVLEPAAAPR